MKSSIAHVLVGTALGVLLLSGCGGTSSGSSPTASASPTASPQDLSGFALYAAGDRAYSSTDGGATWHASRGAHGLFWGVAASDRDHAWIAGNGGQILSTVDGGRSWVRQRVPGGEQELGAITCLDAWHVFAAGTAQKGAFVLSSRNGGRTWRSSPLLEVPHSLNAIACSDKRHVWAAGSPSGAGSSPAVPGAVIASSDGGATWRVQHSDAEASYRGITFSDQRHGWVVGASRDAQAIILRTTDGGASWSEQTFPEANLLSAVTCSDARHVWAVGGAQYGSRATVLATDDGGQTWHAQDLGPFSDGEIHFSATGVTCSDAKHVWVVGTTQHDGVVLASRDGGSSWTVQASRPLSAILNGIAYAP